MARPKSADSTASTDEKIVEVAETPKETVAEKTEDVSPKVETTKKSEVKKVAEDKIVTIKNPKYTYRTVRMNMELYYFDGDGTVKVSNAIAEEFLKLPGFSIVK